jgi:DNA-binding CsgD family transcriptional regulator
VTRHTRLRDRRPECEALDQLLDRVRAGESQVLVVRGEAGVGKTALLDYAVERASGFRVARATGVQSEAELAFAGLQQLCAPMLDRVEHLPNPQRDALGTAFGLTVGEPPDRFLVGLAVLSLLSDAAEGQPLACVVDDAQWLDQASLQALAFVARRLLAEQVALIFAVRDPSEEQELTGLPELVPRGLSDDDARELLEEAIQGPVDERVCDQIVAEARGNPLALLELPRALTPAELAGGFGQLRNTALSGRIEESFRRRLASLPLPTRRLLIVAAAEPTGDPLLLWAAAERLGIEAEAADSAESEGLLEIGARVIFRHPLVRSAVYQAASPEERRSAHGALAEVTDPGVDPDRHAWHRAWAASGRDEGVASELERAAGRAQARGGLAAASAFLARAAELTPDPARRAGRALAAAYAKHQAGAFNAALELLAVAEAGPLAEFQRARAELLHARISFDSSRIADAPQSLLKAAKRLELLDVKLARATYLDALSAGLFAGGLASGGGVRDIAAAVGAAPLPPSQRASDLLLDGYTALFTEGLPSGAQTLRQAVSAFRGDEISREEGLRWRWLAGFAAVLLWDYESWEELSRRQVQLARDAGALSLLPIALTTRYAVHLLAGEFDGTAALVEDVRAVITATGNPIVPTGAAMLSAFRGREAEARELIAATASDAMRRGQGLGLSAMRLVTAVLYNGLGRYPEALAAAQLAADDPVEPLFSAWALIELIEASARTGEAERAARALEQLSTITRASGTEWALGSEARSRALLSTGEAADRLYRDAIDRLGRTHLSVELTRARLLYGEWLRRERRRTEAREQLRTAYELFTEFGMEAFAERARIELKATGETARRRTVGPGGQLTAQEAQIARLARDGLSNPEIASQLFISPRTVEYHLSKVFAKLNISAREQLDRVLPQDPNAAQRAYMSLSSVSKRKVSAATRPQLPVAASKTGQDSSRLILLRLEQGRPGCLPSP